MTGRNESRAFLGFGGNLQDPLQAFRRALGDLAQHPEITLKAASPLYRTPAVGGPGGQPDYLNGVVEIDTALTPVELLKFCRQLEQQAGRTREVRWGARTLDIDLLFFADLVTATELLEIPHPRLHQRHFVLLPLADLAPELRHPLLDRSVGELLAALPEPQGITRLPDSWIEND
jgi:2-amino-4-hydroxy-6-hydroxymethyldihydropteridine diphosphokinase